MKKTCKIFLPLLLFIVLVFNQVQITFAATNLDVLFANTFNAVKKVVTLASENGVKPWYFKSEGSLDIGVSVSENVADATAKGMQQYIYDARSLIDQLPDGLLDYKRTFSSILDNYQHPIYERIVVIINSNQISPNQHDIILTRILIKDVPSFFKASYSSALDSLQGELFVNASQLVDKAVLTKIQSDIDAAKQSIADLKTIPSVFSSNDINNFIQMIESKLNTVIGNSTDVQLKVHYINVGQADSILIQQGSQAMLIDGGNNEDGNLVKTYISNQGITTLDYVIGTHAHEDHIGGLDYVINSFKVGKVYFPKETSTTQTFIDFVDAVKNKGLQLIAPVVGETFKLGDATATILAPNGTGYSDSNNSSVVIKVQYGNNKFLFTGDAEAISENEMISKGFDLKADVLKVGHHGSSSSTTDEFLSAVNPKYAVISVGEDNTYGHPNKTVMDKLKNDGITIYRTDELGTIVATSDGNNINFNTQPGSYIGNESTGSSDDEVNPPVETNNDVQITGLDLSNEIVTIKNNENRDIDMTGWKIVSVEGNQTYNFPYNYILKAGAAITIASGKSTGDLKWTGSYIWNNDGDKAEIYDANGKLISSK
jgi:beta-lactamase superfamily II metal-dependent hydrolase